MTFSRPLCSRGALLGMHLGRPWRPCPHPHPYERALPCTVPGTMARRIMKLGMQVEQPLLGQTNDVMVE